MKLVIWRFKAIQISKQYDMEFFSAKNVNKVFADTKALTNVSISVNKQSIFGLLGPNGAGKTTLIRIINQITAPDSGEVFLEGRTMTRADIGQIGYLPEERGLYKKMKIGDQAIYLAQLKGMSRHDATKNLKVWFEKFEIMTWWNKNIEELSKGMQQKVQFITTIVHKPRLLIFDEPFSGFDPINANLLKQEILNLRDNGATIIFSTHNMESVEELCDHIALINKSVKIVDGQTDEIRERYKSNIFEIKYKGNFNEVSNVLSNGFKILDHIENSRINQITIEYLHGRSNNDIIQALIPVSEILSFEEKIPSMNDVFIKAVEESNKNHGNE
jgi:ABC-2 type transport system ATP-binding protein